MNRIALVCSRDGRATEAPVSGLSELSEGALTVSGCVTVPARESRARGERVESFLSSLNFEVVNSIQFELELQLRLLNSPIGVQLPSP